MEELKNKYKFELEIRSSQIQTSFNNPSAYVLRIDIRLLPVATSAHLRFTIIP